MGVQTQAAGAGTLSPPLTGSGPMDKMVFELDCLHL